MDFSSFLEIDSPFRKGNDLESFEDPVASHFSKQAPNLSLSDRWQTSNDIASDIWPSDASAFRIPESWSQTISTLLSQSIGTSSADSASLNGSTNTSSSTPPSLQYPDASCASAWNGLSASPSDPFHLLHSASVPEHVSTPDPHHDAPAFQVDSSTMPQQLLARLAPASPSNIQSSTSPDSYTSQVSSSLRRFLESSGSPDVTLSPGPQHECVSPADLAQKRNPIPASFLGLPLAQTSPAPARPQQSPFASRGLTGWVPAEDVKHTRPTTFQASNFGVSALAGLRPPCPRPSSVRPAPPAPPKAEIDSHPFTAPPPIAPRTRRSRFSADFNPSPSYDNILGSDDASPEDDDDDVYQPSSSPSRNFSPSREESPFSPDTRGRYSNNANTGYRTISGHSGISVERHSRRGKGKAKGSAALALAVVTQMSKLQQEHAAKAPFPAAFGASHTLDENGHYGATATLARPGRKRKNSTIPLPVPVPHLIKKSRGRKVPYVPVESPEVQHTMDSSSSFASTSFASQSVMEEAQSASGSASNTLSSVSPASGGPSRTARTTSRGRRASLPYSLGEGGKRAYMCEVPGCGKCFVRGEHLKRHVRSIHTYDKPHPCPYNGCDKTFSRRDNLGQHVRIHLQT
ncbi:hypothetical protein D9611_008112 [Ephemerocybe angulata]|uniref:C2H2-type domain-containing protein n=1 Tax=Ephemerocybe angulata TaxID=980116 RepID=A0A8H5BZJ2_9AGAR|nr:hypothetical protein D9611_008112 [Tulosesus angulatus]